MAVDLGAAERLANVNIDAAALQAATQMIASHVVAQMCADPIEGAICALYDKVSAKSLADYGATADGPAVRIPRLAGLPHSTIHMFGRFI